MKTEPTNEIIKANATIAGRCTQSCKQLLAGIGQAKSKIANEFQETLATHTQLLRLALNEAEALAFQTAYPQLIFPTLAVEKVQALSAWQARQQRLQSRRVAFLEAT